MSKKFLVLCSIISIIVITIIFYSLFTLINTTKEPINPVIEQNESNTKQNYEYLLKDINGKINVFKKDVDTPINILDKRTDILPSYDRELLSQGIYLENIEQLNKILEDYDD